MSTHTPGPWRTGGGVIGFIVADHPTGHDDAVNLRYYGGHLVCESVTDRNANIIAAAPDMLAALQAFVSEVEGTYPFESLSAARAAIAKATGAA